MAERRASRRNKFELEAEKRQDSSRPKTQLIFADLKRDLSRVSEAEWAALPEVGDFRIKRLKRSGAIENPKERYLPVPDSVHTSLINNQSTEVVQEEAEEADFVKIGEARGKLLGMHLDQLTQGQKGQVYTNNNSNIDQDSSTSATSAASTLAIASDEKLAEIGDLKRARQLFASIIKTNRKNPSGWISAARLELQAGNQKQARALITKGCEECPKSEEIWSEAIKLHHEAQISREILAKALKNVPESVSLWILAAEREQDALGKKKILRAALERNPSSSKLWMTLVELEESEEDAKLLLTRAVECSPGSVELWLALARLQESTALARQILNRARLACPKSFAVWVNAARLEEANDTPAAEIKKLLSRGATDLSAQGIELTFKDWQREAEECESGGDLICAAELISIGTDLAISIDQSEINNILEYVRATNHVTCAKSCLKTILTRKADCKEAVLLLIEKIKLSNEDFDRDELKQIYENSLDSADSDLWISYARDFTRESREILTRASKVLIEKSDQIKIWKEAILLEMANFRSNSSAVDEFVSKLPPFAELMIDAMRLYQVLGNQARVIDIARDGIEKYPKEADFWICLSGGDVGILKRGLEQNPTNVKLALKIAEISEDFNLVQVLLEKTRLAIQKSKIAVEDYDQILVALCLLNIPRGTNNNNSVLSPEFCPYPKVKCFKDNLAAAKLILNQSLKELPRSGLLWYLAVSLEPRHLRRSKVTEALRRFESPYNQKSSNDEALLRWTLAMILDEKTTKEAELQKSLQLNPYNMDLRAFLNLPFLESCASLKLTNGANWIKFIEDNLFYFESPWDSFEKFLEYLQPGQGR